MDGLTGGHTLVSEGDTASGPVALGGIGLLLAGGAVVFAVAAVMAAEPGLWVGTVVTGLIALVLLGAAAGDARIVRRLEPGVLDLPAPYLQLSSVTPARFRRRVKRGSAQPTAMTARLVLREWVRYTVGTDTRTATHDVSDTPVPILPVPDPHGVAGELTVHLPAYPPTFEASNNKVRWLLIVHVTFADGFEEDSVIPIPVAPAVLTPTPPG